MKRTELDESTSQWDYTDAAQRILIAERARAMLDALASNAPRWDESTPDATREHRVMVFSHLTNAYTSIVWALATMRNPPMAFDSPESIARAAEDAKRTDGPTIPIGAIGQRAIAERAKRSTATAAHACTACGRHPDTHVPAAADMGDGFTLNCPMCGLGEEK